MSQESGDSNDQLTIVNRSMVYNVSKKLVCKKIGCYEFLKKVIDSKESLDYDESTFDLFIDWIKGAAILQFKHLIPLYDIADCLMIDELKNICRKMSRKILSLDFIPMALNQVSDKTRLINKHQLDSFISRNFLLIINSKSFLFYPVDTLIYILKLDLWIESEFDVFQAIINWIEHDANSRSVHLLTLLQSIRWKFVNEDEKQRMKNHELIKGNDIFIDDLVDLVSDELECRLAQDLLICVFKLKETLKIFFLDKSKTWRPLDDFEPCIKTEHRFDSGFGDELIYDPAIDDKLAITNDTIICHDKNMHIDWDKKQYYSSLDQHILKNEYYEVKFVSSGNSQWDFEPNTSIFKNGILEFKGKTIQFRNDFNEGKDFSIKPGFVGPNWNPRRIPATLIKGKAYAYIKSKHQIYCLDLDTKQISWFNPPNPVKSYENDVCLASFDGQLVFFNRLTSDLHFYDFKCENWFSECIGFYPTDIYLKTVTNHLIPKRFLERN